ncbi:serine hydrolase domain-containing protein [Gemmatimonas sp.]|uniref:serine hydrolase domain-containing protein n=1 Tax=Gemmatimonas sp. TaxID=1962908 RepID=UPI0025BDE872|nr:serine hydrolase domain-containing protein [Gemmatimonas sp.]MCA2990145.1 beta-lactamase family protein [Gemmatimonas sp.]
MLMACGGGPTAPAPTPAAPSPSPLPAPPADVRALPFVHPAPGAEWPTVSASALGWDTTALRAALDWAGTQRSTAVVITWRGRLVAERYWRGWTGETDSIIASAGKSVLATLIGQLQAEGRLSLEAPASQYLGAGWSRSPGTEGRITVRHLLQMSSGLDDSLRTVVAPGTRFYYNNPAYYQLFAVVTRAAGQDITTASRTRLFDRIGMSCTWRFNVDTGEPGFVLSCSARDMARFGLLTLSRGAWGTTRVVADTSWVTQMWRPAPHDNPAYGMLWWLNGSDRHRLPGPSVLPTLSGPLVPAAPRDLVAALGKGDKKIYVVPSLDLVVVRHGDEAAVGGGNPLASSTFDEQFWQRLRQAIRY